MHAQSELPGNATFSRRTSFVDWRFQKFRGNNFRGPRIPSTSAAIRYSKISRSLIFEVRFQPRKFSASKIWRYTACTVVVLCVHSYLPPHTSESQKRDTNGFIATQGIVFDVANFPNFFKSYAICLSRAAPAS